jgi:hypothetical protein
MNEDMDLFLELEQAYLMEDGSFLWRKRLI